MAGNAKKKRVRRAMGIERTLAAKVRRKARASAGIQERKKKTSHGVLTLKARRYSVRTNTFEDDYKLYRKTKGRQGLNPNADNRVENIKVLRRNSVFSCDRFPIGELMEKAIRY